MVKEDYVELELHICEVPFTDEEKNTLLFSHGMRKTLEELFSGVQTTSPLKNYEDAIEYLKSARDFAEDFYNAFGDKKHLIEKGFYDSAIDALSRSSENH